MEHRNIQSAVITGPTGAIGIALCRELAGRDIAVFPVCRPGSPRAAALPQHKNIHPLECDIGDLARLPELLPDGADAFFHFAWAHTIGPGRNDLPAQIRNIQHTLDAVQAAKELGCTVLLGAGSQAEYGTPGCTLCPDTPCFPKTGYGMAKLCAGQMSRMRCEQLGIDHIWVRVLSVYGPGDGPGTMISSVIRQLLAGEKPALTEARQQWDYLYSGDAARAFFMLAQHGVSGRVYPLGSGNAVPLREYLFQLRDCIDPALPLGFGEIPYGPDPVMYLRADLSALQEDTGFVPETSFSDGIRRTIECYKEACRHGG